MVLMPLLSRLLTLLVILTMPLFLARLTLIPIKSLSICFRVRSEERFSRNAETDLVCRLLLEKKKKRKSMQNRRNRNRICLEFAEDEGAHQYTRVECHGKSK